MKEQGLPFPLIQKENMVFVRTLDQAKTRVKKIAILSPIEDDIAFEMRNGQVVRTIARGKVDDSEEKEEKPESGVGARSTPGGILTRSAVSYGRAHSFAGR